jgi:hypothetical protein
MHTFIVFTLILNTHAFTIHEKTKFMVILCNQNLHFKAQCRKIQRQNYNSLHHIFDSIENSHNNMDMEIAVKFYTCLFYWKKNSIKITTKFHV